MTDSSGYKKGKLPIYSAFIAYFPRSIKALTELTCYGAKKHNRNDWKDRSHMDEELFPLEGYDNAIMRHIVDRAIHGEINEEDDNQYHRVQIAWNAMVALEKFLLNNEEKKDNTSIIDVGYLFNFVGDSNGQSTKRNTK